MSNLIETRNMEANCANCDYGFESVIEGKTDCRATAELFAQGVNHRHDYVCGDHPAYFNITVVEDD